MIPILTVYDEQGNPIPIPAIQGPPGPTGPKGEDYVLTDADKQEIAELAAAIVDTELLDLIGTGVLE